MGFKLRRWGQIDSTWHGLSRRMPPCIWGCLDDVNRFRSTEGFAIHPAGDECDATNPFEYQGCVATYKICVLSREPGCFRLRQMKNNKAEPAENVDVWISHTYDCVALSFFFFLKTVLKRIIFVGKCIRFQFHICFLFPTDAGPGYRRTTDPWNAAIFLLEK